MIRILHTEKLYLNLLGSLSSIANDNLSLKSEEKKILNNGILVHYVAILVLTPPSCLFVLHYSPPVSCRLRRHPKPVTVVDHTDDHYKECCIPM